ncbi:MAG: hypothetical protein WC856_28905, partial [Methylococcaceae bacterium]
MAGDKRQLELLSKNTDLIAPLQSPQRVQELAFRRLLSGAWEGSENVYSAALLSTVDDFKGEARGYLRSANNWLNAYFEERKKRQPGSRYFCESFYGHPCPTSGKNYATAHACGCPSRPASFVGY